MEKNKKTIFEKVERLEKMVEALIDDRLKPPTMNDHKYLMKVQRSANNYTDILLDFLVLESVKKVGCQLIINDTITGERYADFKDHDLSTAAMNDLDTAWRKWINGK